MLAETAHLLDAVDLSDWWPDPEARSEGAATRRFLQDVQRDLDRLSTTTEPPSEPISVPPILGKIASETEILASIWPYTADATAAIERRIDEHLERILPKVSPAAIPRCALAHGVSGGPRWPHEHARPDQHRRLGTGSNIWNRTTRAAATPTNAPQVRGSERPLRLIHPPMWLISTLGEAAVALVRISE